MNKKMLWLFASLSLAAFGMAARRRKRAGRAIRWFQYMYSPLQRRALVTGASSGIGEAYARRLALLGYDLVLVARRLPRLEQLAQDYRTLYNVQVEVLPADLSTETGIASVEQYIARRGDIEFLVNSAGYDVLGPFAEIELDKMLGLLHCQALSTTRLCRAALPGMLQRKRGALVNVSSIGAFVPKPHDTTYVSAKAFVNMFSRSLATELAGTNVRVQALCPGFVTTEFHDAPEYAQYQIKQRIPAWLWMKPEEVVAASLQATAEGQVVCIPGLKNQLIVAIARSGLSSYLIDALRAFFRKQQSHRYHKTLLRPQSLDLLACPVCRGNLELRGTPESGELYCSACQKQYEIRKGLPRFAPYQELDGLNKRFARLYDYFSYVYLPFSRVAGLLLGGERHMRTELLQRLEPCGGRVLEVSIGPGVNLPYLIERPDVGDIYGLDISIGQLEHCQQFASRHNYPVELFQGNAEQLPFKDETFESVFHIGGINFFNDKRKAIEEMIRVAKPGAKIIIADETERGARGYELSLPGFSRSFKSKRQPVRPPLDLVPPEMVEVQLDEAPWRGWFYCIEFHKPRAG